MSGCAEAVALAGFLTGFAALGAALRVGDVLFIGIKKVLFFHVNGNTILNLPEGITPGAAGGICWGVIPSIESRHHVLFLIGVEGVIPSL